MEQNQVKLNGEVVRLVRVNLGLTQGELAEKVGVSTGLISAIELGTKSVSRKVEPRLREVFGISDEALQELIEATNRIKRG